MGFYVAFLEGMKRELFPELVETFPKFTRTGDWPIISEVVSMGNNRARHYAETIIDIHQRGKEEKDEAWAEQEIWRHLLSPMGIANQKVG